MEPRPHLWPFSIENHAQTPPGRPRAGGRLQFHTRHSFSLNFSCITFSAGKVYWKGGREPENETRDSQPSLKSQALLLMPWL